MSRIACGPPLCTAACAMPPHAIWIHTHRTCTARCHRGSAHIQTPPLGRYPRYGLSTTCTGSRPKRSRWRADISREPDFVVISAGLLSPDAPKFALAPFQKVLDLRRSRFAELYLIRFWSQGLWSLARRPTQLSLGIIRHLSQETSDRSLVMCVTACNSAPAEGHAMDFCVAGECFKHPAQSESEKAWVTSSFPKGNN